jgi:ABC-type phosphate transport system substrate-binding protein
MKMKLLGAALLAASFATAVDAGSVVVGKDSPVASMSQDEVQRLFLGRTASVGGAPAVVVFQKGGATRTAFDDKVLGKPGAQLTSHWSKLVFTGKAKAPEEVDGDAAVKAKVAATPGAVGYIDDGAVDASVKVVYQF